MKDIDKYRGCLIGGAAGDTLGYEVEFLDESAIFSRFGERGITEYALRDGVAQISDDTQMTCITTCPLQFFLILWYNNKYSMCILKNG